MIYIEKLSLKYIKRYTWQTFVDNFLGSKETRKYLLEEHRPWEARTYINNNILTPLILKKLKGVTIGKHFGTIGADIDLLIENSYKIENLVIEISRDHLNVLPSQKLKRLFENFTIIINDFEEGGNLFISFSLVDFLNQHAITPKKIFLVGGCFRQRDYPKLNIVKIDYDFWMVVSATINEDFSKSLFDSQYKTTLLDRLDNEPSNFCIIPVFKPRLHRLDLLTYLDKLDLLDNCDWSLAHKYENLNNIYRSYDIDDTDDSINLNFLQKYTFPKKLSVDTGKEWKDLLSPSIKLFNRYKYYVSAETYIGTEISDPLGESGFLTEKTFKLFLMGSAPIIFAAPGAIDRLNKLGFKTLHGNKHTDNYQEVGNLLNELSKNSKYEKEIVKHNFNLITDADFLASHVASTLNTIADLINSIRR